MSYMMLYAEYKKIYSQKTEAKKKLTLLPEGYISEKVISGKTYYYLQKRVSKKLVSEYIKTSELDEIRKKVEERKILASKISELDAELTKIERAAEILGTELIDKIRMHKKCAVLDVLSAGDREKVADFSRAMLAIEGVEAPSYAQSEFDKWVSGKHSFADGYTAILKRYNLTGAR